MWARIMRERFGAKDPRSQTLRFHTQTGGATLTAQQPENNIVRTALEAMAAVLGGTQSLHTNSFDEALALPTEQAVKIALRTQQVIGFETGVAETVGPARRLVLRRDRSPMSWSGWPTAIVEKIDAMGGAVAAIEAGFYQDEIHEAAFRIQRGIETGRAGRRRREPVRRRGREARRAPADLRGGDGAAGRAAPGAPRLAGSGAVDAALAEVEETARGTGNLLPPMREALRPRATLGEVSDVLRAVFGEYRPDATSHSGFAPWTSR